MAWIQWTLGVAFLSMTTACQFPYQSGSWSDLQPTKTTIYTFSNTSFTKINCNSKDCSTLRYTCKESYQNGVYYVEINRIKPRRATVFSCLAFLLHSEYVFQIRESDQMLYEYDDICGRKNLKINRDITIADHIPDDITAECPFSGGQFMSVYDSNSYPTCPIAAIQPRVEVGCMYKSSLMFDFLRGNCMDDRLSMSSQQTVTCAQSWTHRQHKYYLLRGTPASNTYWCLRVNATATPGRPDSALLFMAQECPVGQKKFNFLKLMFTPVPRLESECSDPFEVCEDERVCEDESMKRFCPRKCELCQPVQPSCTFPLALRGRWHGGDNKILLDVSTHSVTFPDGRTFRCYAERGFQYVVTLSQGNSCFPQFVCLDIRKLYPSSLEYFSSESPTWVPLNFSNIIDDVCNRGKTSGNGAYTNTASTPELDLTDGIRVNTVNEAKEYKLLINTDRSPRFISCWLHDWFPLTYQKLFEQNETGTDQICSSCVTYDWELRGDAFSDVIFNCSNLNESFNSETKETLNQCIGLFSEDGELNTRVILTKTHLGEDEFLCWVFKDYDNSEAGNTSVHVYDLETYNIIRVSGSKEVASAKRVMEIVNAQNMTSCPASEFIVPVSTASIMYGQFFTIITAFSFISYLWMLNML